MQEGSCSYTIHMIKYLEPHEVLQVYWHLVSDMHIQWFWSKVVLLIDFSLLHINSKIDFWQVSLLCMEVSLTENAWLALGHPFKYWKTMEEAKLIFALLDPLHRKLQRKRRKSNLRFEFKSKFLSLVFFLSSYYWIALIKV